MSTIMNDSGRQVIAETYWLDGARTFRVLLVDDTYVPAASDVFVNDVVAYEVAGPGYSRVTLSGLTVNVAVNRANCNADCPTWVGLDAGIVGSAVVYEEITNDADSLIICTLDPVDLLTVGIDVTLRFGSQETSGPVFRV